MKIIISNYTLENRVTEAIIETLDDNDSLAGIRFTDEADRIQEGVVSVEDAYRAFKLLYERKIDLDKETV